MPVFSNYSLDQLVKALEMHRDNVNQTMDWLAGVCCHEIHHPTLRLVLQDPATIDVILVPDKPSAPEPTQVFHNPQYLFVLLVFPLPGSENETV